jgi:hypothetical protein
MVNELFKEIGDGQYTQTLIHYIHMGGLERPMIFSHDNYGFTGKNKNPALVY